MFNSNFKGFTLYDPGHFVVFVFCALLFVYLCVSVLFVVLPTHPHTAVVSIRGSRREKNGRRKEKKGKNARVVSLSLFVRVRFIRFVRGTRVRACKHRHHHRIVTPSSSVRPRFIWFGHFFHSMRSGSFAPNAGIVCWRRTFSRRTRFPRPASLARGLFAR